MVDLVQGLYFFFFFFIPIGKILPEPKAAEKVGGHITEVKLNLIDIYVANTSWIAIRSIKMHKLTRPSDSSV